MAVQPLEAHESDVMYPRPSEQSLRPPVALEIPGTTVKYAEIVDPSPPLAAESVTYENMPSQWFCVLGMTICNPFSAHPLVSDVPRTMVQFAHP